MFCALCVGWVSRAGVAHVRAWWSLVNEQLKRNMPVYPNPLAASLKPPYCARIWAFILKYTYPTHRFTISSDVGASALDVAYNDTPWAEPKKDTRTFKQVHECCLVLSVYGRGGGVTLN